VLVSAAALSAADENEQRYWRADGEVTLRGRATPTPLVSLHVG
jgi:class 3 adenylate cyclase